MSVSKTIQRMKTKASLVDIVVDGELEDENNDKDYSEFTSILFGDFDLSKLILVGNNQLESQDADNLEPMLYHKEKDILINKTMFKQILDFIRITNNIKEPKKRNFSSDFVKREVIDAERRKIKRRQRENKEFESMMSSIVSRLVNTSGFKYNYDTILNLRISQFYDALAQLQSISEYEHLMSGIYAGTVQYDKIADKSVLNWIKINK